MEVAPPHQETETVATYSSRSGSEFDTPRARPSYIFAAACAPSSCIRSALRARLQLYCFQFDSMFALSAPKDAIVDRRLLSHADDGGTVTSEVASHLLKRVAKEL